jgi:TonB family protein
MQSVTFNGKAVAALYERRWDNRQAADKPAQTAVKAAPRLATPLVIAIVAHLAVAGILAAIPLYRGLTPSKFQPASVRFTFSGMAEPGGNPEAGGSGPGEVSTATILQPETVSPTSLPPMPPVVIGVFDPVAVTADTHLNVQIGTAPPPGAGTGHGTGTGIGDGSEPGMVGLGGDGAGGGTGGYPSCLRSPKPSYPELARQRGWEGTTVLLVEVRADGTVGLVEVRQSSGHRLLDDTSIETVRAWKFNPARRDDTAVATWVEIPIRYQLNQG